MPSFENVDATQVPFCAMKDRTSSAGETEESTSPISDRSNQVDFTLPAASLVFHTAEATQCINAVIFVCMYIFLKLFTVYVHSRLFILLLIVCYPI